MKIELIRGTVIAGEGKDPGAIVDVDASLASMLIATGKGIPATEKPAKVDRSVGLETSSAPKTKTRKAE
jgi:hypothetical protein